MSRVIALAFIEPQLPTLTEQPPHGEGWLHEVKHDGYRTMLAILRGTVFAYSRNGFDWTNRYPGIVKAAAQCLMARSLSKMLMAYPISIDCKPRSKREAVS
jgi:ATP-dependent DNA ligase